MSNKLTAVIGADTSQFSKSVESARNVLQKYTEAAKGAADEIRNNVGVTNQQITSYSRVVKALDKVKSGELDARKQHSLLKKSIEELRVQWQDLSDEAKDSDFGRAMSESIRLAEARMSSLTDQMKEAKEQMKSISSSSAGGAPSGGISLAGGIDSIKKAIQGLSTGDISDIEDSLQNISELDFSSATGSLTKFVNPWTALAAAVVGCGIAYTKYNTALDESLTRTEQFTGYTGDQLNSLRNGIQSVASTWGKDYNEVLAAVDGMMSKFGIDGETALTYIRDGFVAGADEAGNMMDMIDKFSGSFQDAGVKADELVAIIAQTRNGIFSEQGMELISKAGMRIRAMSDGTKQALQSIGIDADKMTAGLKDGTITTMDAIKQLTAKLKEFAPNSKEVGEVLQAVFEEQGAAAGYELVTALSEVSTNLEQVKTQTGEQGVAMQELQEAQRELENSLMTIFGTSELGWDTMITTVKTEVIGAITAFINKLIDLYNNSIAFRGAWENIVATFKTLWIVVKGLFNAIGIGLKGLGQFIEGLLTLDVDKMTDALSGAFRDTFENISNMAEDFTDNLKSQWNNTLNGEIKMVQTVDVVEEGEPKKPKTKPKAGGGVKTDNQVTQGSKPQTKVTYDPVKTVSDLQKDIESKTAQLHVATSDADKKSIQDEIDALTERKNKIEFSVEYSEAVVKKINDEIKDKKAKLEFITDDATREKVKDEIKELTDRKNAIEFEIKYPAGSLARLDKEISDKQAEYKLAIDNESRLKIQKELDLLAEKKRNIELLVQPVVNGDTLTELEKKIADRQVDVQVRLHEQAVSSKPQTKVERAQSNAENLQEELEFNKEIVDSYRKQYVEIQKKVALGAKLNNNEQSLLGIYENATSAVEDLTKAYEDAANAANRLNTEAEFDKAVYEGSKEIVGGLGNINSSIAGTVGAWENLADNWTNMSTFEKVTAGFDTVIGTISEAFSMYESLNGIIQAFQAISDAAAAKEAANSSIKIASMQAEAATDTATTQVQIANDQQEQASNLSTVATDQAKSISGATKAGASLPFPANIAAIAAGIAAVVAAFAMIGSFAGGGVISGATSIGDYNLAKVNSGEMILNGSQQSHLFKLLDSDTGGSSTSFRHGLVEFKIKGPALVGTLKNTNSRSKKIG